MVVSGSVKADVMSPRRPQLYKVQLITKTFSHREFNIRARTGPGDIGKYLFLGRKMPLSVAVKNSLSIKIEKDTHRSSIIMRHLTFKCKPSLQHSHLFTRFNSNSNHFAQRVHVFYFYNIVCAVSYSSDLI